MMIDFYLVSVANTVDASGIYHKSVETKRRVLGERSGITRSEWAAAGHSGHRPELSVVVPFADYSGELEAEVDSVRYRIYRTSAVNNDWEVELYLERKAGV